MKFMKIIVTITIALSVIVGISSCSIFPTNNSSIVSPVNWKIGISFPKFELGIFEKSTVGKWQSIADYLETYLVEKGYKKDNIIIKNSADRVTQVQDVEELVDHDDVDQIIVVPVQFSKVEILNGAKDNVALPGNTESLVDVLGRAHNKKVWTALWGSQDLEGFSFDYGFNVPNVEDIANVQFGFFKNKYQLPDIDSNDYIPEAPSGFIPLNIEVLASDPVRESSKKYFARLLKRLLPYYRSGYLFSPSGYVKSNTNADAYKNVSVIEDGDKAAGVMHNLLNSFYKNASSTKLKAQHIDAIFCQTDAQARGAVRSVVELGWKSSDLYYPTVLGSGAEKVSVLDIVEDKEAMSVAFDSKALAYGAAEVISDIATKKRTITKDANSDISQKFKEYLDGKNSVLYLEYVSEDNDKNQKSHPILMARSIIVEPANVKEFLVDGGYILPQDAGI